MSRSNSTELINPCTRYYEWSGSEGKLKYYDKTKGEGENVFVALPFTFLVLDKLHTIAGFSDADQSGFWSNEVRDLKTEPLSVRTKKGLEATELYENLAHILNKGAKYAQSVYIAYHNDEKKLVIGNLKLAGSAISAWIEFCKKKDIYKIAITVSGATAKKKGATNYFEPVFTVVPKISPATEESALALDKELQEYLTKYFNKQKATQEEPAEVAADVQAKAAELEEEVRYELTSDIMQDDSIPF